MTKPHRKPPKILGISKPTNRACIACRHCENCIGCYKNSHVYESVSTLYSSHSVGLRNSISCRNCYHSEYLEFCTYCYHSVDLAYCEACSHLYCSSNCYQCHNHVLAKDKMWFK